MKIINDYIEQLHVEQVAFNVISKVVSLLIILLLFLIAKRVAEFIFEHAIKKSISLSHQTEARQKTIIKLLNSLEGRYSRWDIWQDFIVLSAVSIANAFGGPYREQREAMYLERSKKYSSSELEVLAQMSAEVVDEMEQNPDQDMLGELFMALGLAKTLTSYYK